MVERGWALDDVRWLVATGTDTAESVSALDWRIKRAENATPQKARGDQYLLTALGLRSRSGKGYRAASRPGSIEEHGETRVLEGSGW